MLAEAASPHHARTGQSGGNGSLTRTAPVAFAFLRDRDGLAAAARAVPALTQSTAAGTLDFYVTHRAERLAEIAAAVAAGDTTPAQIVARVYAAVEPALGWPRRD